jgi:hypothetical protein
MIEAHYLENLDPSCKKDVTEAINKLTIQNQTWDDDDSNPQVLQAIKDSAEFERQYPTVPEAGHVHSLKIEFLNTFKTRDTFMRNQLIGKELHLNFKMGEQLRSKLNTVEANISTSLKIKKTKKKRSKKTIELKVVDLVRKIKNLQEQNLSKVKILKKLSLHKKCNTEVLGLVKYLFEDKNVINKFNLTIKTTSDDNCEDKAKGRLKKLLDVKVMELVTKIEELKKQKLSKSKILKKLNLYQLYNILALERVKYLFENY